MGPGLNSTVPAFYKPEVTSLLNFAEMCRISQLCACFMGLIMSHSERESPDNTMDFSQVEITNVREIFNLCATLPAVMVLGA